MQNVILFFKYVLIIALGATPPCLLARSHCRISLIWLLISLACEKLLYLILGPILAQAVFLMQALEFSMTFYIYIYIPQKLNQ